MKKGGGGVSEKLVEKLTVKVLLLLLLLQGEALIVVHQGQKMIQTEKMSGVDKKLDGVGLVHNRPSPD